MLLLNKNEKPYSLNLERFERISVFVSSISDERCAPETVCEDPGDAEVTLSVQTPTKSERDIVTLSLSNFEEASFVDIDEHRITLKSVGMAEERLVAIICLFPVKRLPAWLPFMPVLW